MKRYDWMTRRRAAVSPASGTFCTRALALGVSAVGLLAASSLLVSRSAAEETEGTVPASTPVRIEREKPESTKRPSLVFLRENLDFLRAQIDGVYWTEDARGRDANAIDPRWLEYLEMEQSLGAADAALRGEDAELAGGRLLGSVGELVAVDERLGELASLLDAHEARLARLHEDYVEDHVTSVVLLARGYPGWSLDGLRLRREDGRETVLSLDPGLERVLREGGVVEIDHEFIEPRTQWLELGIPAAADHEAITVYLEVRPERDRLHFVQLDLSSFDLARPTSEWRAESWSRPAVFGSMDWTW